MEITTPLCVKNAKKSAEARYKLAERHAYSRARSSLNECSSGYVLDHFKVESVLCDRTDLVSLKDVPVCPFVG